MTLVLQTFFVFEEKYLYFPAGQKLCNNLMLTDARRRLNRSRRHDIINLLQSKGTSDMRVHCGIRHAVGGISLARGERILPVFDGQGEPVRE